MGTDMYRGCDEGPGQSHGESSQTVDDFEIDSSFSVYRQRRLCQHDIRHKGEGSVGFC